MILVDTSVWIDHLRASEPVLVGLLNTGHVLVHPFIVGELACGQLQNRAEILALLQELSAAPVATHEEVLFFIERHRVMGRGIGYIDAHLLSAVSLTGAGQLWTRDKRLHAIAETMNVSFAPAE